MRSALILAHHPSPVTSFKPFFRLPPFAIRLPASSGPVPLCSVLRPYAEQRAEDAIYDKARRDAGQARACPPGETAAEEKAQGGGEQRKTAPRRDDCLLSTRATGETTPTEGMDHDRGEVEQRRDRKFRPERHVGRDAGDRRCLPHGVRQGQRRYEERRTRRDHDRKQRQCAGNVAPLAMPLQNRAPSPSANRNATDRAAAIARTHSGPPGSNLAGRGDSLLVARCWSLLPCALCLFPCTL